MIRKFARFSEPRDRLLRIFADYERWPEWMPGVESARILASRDGWSIVETTQRHFGRRWEQTLECRVEDPTIRLHQTKGFFRRYDARWSFRAGPEHEGTSVSCEMDIDLGMVGLFTSNRTVQAAIDDLFDATMAGARRRLTTQGGGPQEEMIEGETLLRIYQRPTGLEVWVAGKTFLIDANGAHEL